MLLAESQGFVLPLIVGIVCLVIGAGVALLIPGMGLKKSQQKAAQMEKDAKAQADQIVRTAQLDAKTSAYEQKLEAEKELKERKQEASNLENKLLQREQNIDRRDLALQTKEDNLEEKHNQVNQKLQDLDKKEADLDSRINSIISELEKVAGMTSSQAKDELFKQVEEKTAIEMAAYIKNQEEEAKATANEKSQELLAFACQKYAHEVANERTVSVVSLPSDDLKGRIIGREGRNIRTLEQLTGVDLIIDDTPGVITVSCFNPVRREVARLALEALIKDGRIQPGRIEEVVAKAQAEVEENIHKAGEDTLFQCGISKMAPELVYTLGKLKYRTSYGQNALRHSIEVADLASIMASELGLDSHLARRAGLLHDIGKGLDFEQEGTHVELGVKLAKKCGESKQVINAIACHHGDCEPSSLYGPLVIAADALSAARPGARSESLEKYIERIEALEGIANSFEGVQTAYAIQAGREIRVMVVPEKVDDVAAFKLASDIRERIEKELTYPGQIKVNVIRETRASEVAK
ncbi:MAG: ribonuclease Y [Bacilli bacterium]|nr:ribonuclease Y [Bacilli bacterium]MDD3422122.1 ribonuclease Y [Bacilli bacterium]MDD4065422.1 ribonuclease Y [Bacilli bacterium]